METVSKANDRQEGGSHYRDQAIQAWDVITAWGLGFLDGNAVKYISRWRVKGGIEDLKKARHYLDKLIEQEEARIRDENFNRSVAKSAAAAQLTPTHEATEAARVPHAPVIGRRV